MADQVMCYVGKTSCGCYVAAAVITGQHQKDTAKAVAQWIREGLAIEQQSVEWVRENLNFCEHRKKKSKQGALL